MLELKSDEIFFPNVVALMPRQRAAAGEAQVHEACAAIRAFYHEMNAALRQQEYLAGAFSFADIAFYMTQFFAEFLGEPPSQRA